jgi:hypothetical protein
MKLLSELTANQNLLECLKITKDTQDLVEINQKSDKSRTHRYWTLEDDEKLSKLAKDLNYDWKKIAVDFPNRSASEVEQRWRQRIDPSTKKTSWTKEEDAILENMHKKFGGKWKLISAYLPGRLPSSIKNRFYGKIFKQPPKVCAKVIEPAPCLFDDEDLIDSLLDLSDNESSCPSSTSQSSNSSFSASPAGI